MNKNKQKWIWLALTAIVVVIAAFFFLRPAMSQNSKVSYEYKELQRGDLEILVDSTGTLSALETVEVGSQVSGIIKALYVDYNSVVKKDQILAELDKTPFEMTVRDAQANLISSKAKMDQAEAEHRRNQTLFDKGHISETEYLGTKTSYQTCKAAYSQAEAALSKAKINLGYTVIRSPIDGTIIERSVNQGQTIAASFQAPTLFIIAQDLKQMQIEAQVDESDIGQIKEGQKTRFTVQSYPDNTFTGTVRQIRLQPETIQNVVNYTVVIDAANEQGLLLPGMTATVDFVVDEKKDVLLVPNSAIGFSPPQEILARLTPPQGQGGSTRTPPAVSPNADRTIRPPQDLARVFYLDESKAVKMAFFRKGLSDGKMTELLESRDLKEGMMLLTGSGSAAKTVRQQSGGFFGPPPGARH